jgi:hypothetical protein
MEGAFPGPELKGVQQILEWATHRRVRKPFDQGYKGLSAIFASMLGDDRISSRFSRTAAITDAAMSRTAFNLF